ncbi:hypothetical protein JCM24511_10173 [Saitozyma sp. JCM 24511]|nr:hypothetical protein JCM24511_10173 [Saitozyma sp. JCM 24511]
MALQRPATGENYFCNAWFMAEPRARFMDLWWESYEHFDSSSWDYNSGAKSLELGKAYPKDVQVLNPYAVFWPTWDGAAKVVTEDDYDFHATGQYAMPGATEIYYALTPFNIKDTNSSFHRLARDYIGDRDEEIYASIVGHDL